MIPPYQLVWWNFLRSFCVMKFHWCHTSELQLKTFCVVEIYIIFNSFYKFFFRSEFLQIVHLRFQNTSISLHRTIVDTSSNSGHALSHTSLFDFVMEDFACVLKPSVTVKQRMSCRIAFYRFIKSIKNKLIVVACSDFV